MKNKKRFPEPLKGSVFFENTKMYACLASHPIVEGHTIVVWKDDINDLNALPPEDFCHLMMAVYRIRKVLMEIFTTDKVYLVYLDEIRHVHIHLFPRKPDGEKGFWLMTRPHSELKDLSKIPLLKAKSEEIFSHSGSHINPTFYFSYSLLY